MEESYIEVVFTTMKDNDSDSLNINAKLILSSLENDEDKSIGYANMYIFNEYRVNSWDELMDNADSISGDVLEVIDILSKANENEEIFGLVAVLDNIEIDKEYRNNGYCSELIDNILDYLGYIGTTYIGLIPARIYEDKVVQNDENAINYYMNKGFIPISRRIEGNIIMGKSLL